MSSSSAPKRTRTPAYHQAAVDGLVRPIALNEWQVELAYRNRLQHNVVLVKQIDPQKLAGTPTVDVPQCLDCRKVESGYEQLMDCEKAVQVLIRLQANRERTRRRKADMLIGIDRVRAKHPKYDEARREAKRQAVQYLYRVIHSLDMPAEVDPNSEYWNPKDGSKPDGRPPTNPWDLVFLAALYGGKGKTTLADFILEAEVLYGAGLLSEVPKMNWPSEALRKPWVREKLKEAIGKAVLPVAHLVKVVASDKTGEEEQGAHTYRAEVWGPRGAPAGEDSGWVDRAKKARSYTGLHLVVDVELGLIVAADAQPGNRHESAFIRPLMADMVRYAKVNPTRVLLDMGYSSPTLVQNLWDAHGIEAVTPPKQGSVRSVQGAPRWTPLYDLYWNKYEEFCRIYGKRSVIEAVNSALKEAHGEALKTVNPDARLAEALGKALMHTVNRVLQVMLERGMGHPAVSGHAEEVTGS